MGAEIGGSMEEKEEVKKEKRRVVPKGEHPSVQVEKHSSKRRSVALSGREGIARYARSIKEIEEGRKKIEKTSKEMLKKLGVEVKEERKPGMMTRWVNNHLPTRIIPKAVKETFEDWFHTEDPDLLEVLEEKSRENVDSLQSSVSSVVECARLEKEEIRELEEDLARAIEEEWDARTLHEYMAGKSDIAVYQEIAEFLDSQFDLLSKEKREERKKYLLYQLHKNVQSKQELMKAHEAVCFVGLDLVHMAIVNHYRYVHIRRPLATIRDAAKSMGDTNLTIDATNKAVKEVYELSMKIIDTVYEATKALEQTSITSGNTEEVFKDKRQALETKVKEFENMKSAYVGSLPQLEMSRKEIAASVADEDEEAAEE